jgi:hypothetical protein
MAQAARRLTEAVDGFLASHLLHLVRQLGQPPPQERAHMPAHVLQERVVGPSVASEPADQ